MVRRRNRSGRRGFAVGGLGLAVGSQVIACFVAYLPSALANDNPDCAPPMTVNSAGECVTSNPLRSAVPGGAEEAQQACVEGQVGTGLTDADWGGYEPVVIPCQA